MKEHGLLHEGDDDPMVGDSKPLLCGPGAQLVGQLAGEVLRLPPGQLERRVLGALAITEPLVVVAAKDPRVVLQLDEMQPAAAEQEQVDLVPPAVRVPELEVGPSPERNLVGQDVSDQGEALGLMRELRVGHLDPALTSRITHGVASALASLRPCVLASRLDARRP